MKKKRRTFFVEIEVEGKVDPVIISAKVNGKDAVARKSDYMFDQSDEYILAEGTRYALLITLERGY